MAWKGNPDAIVRTTQNAITVGVCVDEDGMRQRVKDVGATVASSGADGRVWLGSYTEWAGTEMRVVPGAPLYMSREAQKVRYAAATDHGVEYPTAAPPVRVFPTFRLFSTRLATHPHYDVELIRPLARAPLNFGHAVPTPSEAPFKLVYKSPAFRPRPVPRGEQHRVVERALREAMRSELSFVGLALTPAGDGGMLTCLAGGTTDVLNTSGEVLVPGQLVRWREPCDALSPAGGYGGQKPDTLRVPGDVQPRLEVVNAETMAEEFSDALATAAEALFYVPVPEGTQVLLPPSLGFQYAPMEQPATPPIPADGVLEEHVAPLGAHTSDAWVRGSGVAGACVYMAAVCDVASETARWLECRKTALPVGWREDPSDPTLLRYTDPATGQVTRVNVVRALVAAEILTPLADDAADPAPPLVALPGVLHGLLEGTGVRDAHTLDPYGRVEAANERADAQLRRVHEALRRLHRSAMHAYADATKSLSPRARVIEGAAPNELARVSLLTS